MVVIDLTPMWLPTSSPISIQGYDTPSLFNGSLWASPMLVWLDLFKVRPILFLFPKIAMILNIHC
jgi:hypothetical protein